LPFPIFPKKPPVSQGLSCCNLLVLYQHASCNIHQPAANSMAATFAPPASIHMPAKSAAVGYVQILNIVMVSIPHAREGHDLSGRRETGCGVLHRTIPGTFGHGISAILKDAPPGHGRTGQAGHGPVRGKTPWPYGTCTPPSYTGR
jgi:hypothetical protein